MSLRLALIIASRRGVRRPSDTGPVIIRKTKMPPTTTIAHTATAAIRKATFAERLIKTNYSVAATWRALDGPCRAANVTRTSDTRAAESAQALGFGRENCFNASTNTRGSPMAKAINEGDKAPSFSLASDG